jgi:hypothetical protein
MERKCMRNSKVTFGSITWPVSLAHFCRLATLTPLLYINQLENHLLPTLSQQKLTKPSIDYQPPGNRPPVDHTLQPNFRNRPIAHALIDTKK